MTPLNRLRPGTKGWIGCALYVLAFDSLSNETMSTSFRDAVKHPRRRWHLLVAWTLLTLHLTTERFDVLRQISRRIYR